MTGTDAVGSAIRVLLVDDQQLVRAGFRLILERDPDIEVIAEASDGRKAVDLIRLHRPDVALMDVRMPEVDGIEATRAVVDDPALASTRVLVLTTYEHDEYIVDAIEAGASGFLLKDVEPHDLRQAVHRVVEGDGTLSPSVASRVMQALRARADRAPTGTERLTLLTDREREVLTLVGRGHNNAEIGERLHMAPSTAKTHVGRLLTKLHARDRVRLVVIAYETGLVGPGQGD